jgi:extradiol dioxygenase family protein
MTEQLRPFHLAIAVGNLTAARRFYGEVLGCREGRSSSTWVDFDFFGHQLVCHETDSPQTARCNQVDGDTVPVPHFGVVLTLSAWQALAERLRTAEQSFVIEPHVRFAGEVGEQGTFFLYDPFANALEFKGFADLGSLFAA